MSDQSPRAAGTPETGLGDDRSSPPPGPAPPPRPASPSGEQTSADAASGDADVLRVLVACVLAWAVPGLGHLSVGRIVRGVVFGVVILSLFVGGIALDGKVYRPEEGMPLTYLAAFGAAGVGLPYVLAHAAGYGAGDLASPNFDYGNTFTLVAGLLNLLVILDAYDVATGRR